MRRGAPLARAASRDPKGARVSTPAEDLELYGCEGSSLAESEGEAERATRNCVLAWRVIRFLATLQLRDLEEERTELKAVLKRAYAELGA
jgi:hypothetical protein